eukprot:m.269218 g.269218  ORF g.269218 m.269218 type:complete len:90 (+) comp15669_c0_seq8:2049-2318(+)
MDITQAHSHVSEFHATLFCIDEREIVEMVKGVGKPPWLSPSSDAISPCSAKNESCSLVNVLPLGTHTHISQEVQSQTNIISCGKPDTCR